MVHREALGFETVATSRLGCPGISAAAAIEM
jgi:hypothetical protein